jgi:glycolate oxidase FAD binding subunit
MTDYSLYNLKPSTVLQANSIDALAEQVRQANSERTAIVPWGSGTRQYIGAAPSRYDIALDLKGMNRIIEHNPADLVVTVEAGVTLASVQEALAQHGQTLPWDPPVTGNATIGGLLASLASGPLRLGYGPPRDWTLGMRVVLGDGRIVKSGSKVVKNVAGYDSHKLHLGALGTLGIIAEVTFKVASPLQAHRSVLLPVANSAQALQAIKQFRANPIGPISLLALNQAQTQAFSRLDGIVDRPEAYLVIARYAGIEAAVERQVATALERCAGLGTKQASVVDDQTDGELWQALAQIAAGNQSGLLLRAGAQPKQLAEVARVLETTADQHAWNSAITLYGGVGLTYARWQISQDAVEVAAALAQARAALPANAHLVVEDAPLGLRDQLDIWGKPAETIGLMRGLKAQWNPNDLINPGRYLV